MATEEKEKGYGGGVGGKFRKRPFRKTQTTPYDRPPTSLRNPNSNNGWLSKLVDPAHRLITYSAHSLFSSLFRKRLPPPASIPSTGTEQEVRNQEEAAYVANNSSGKQQGLVGGSDAQTNCSNGGGLSELEKLLKQKTFTRSEIDHLTALMHSRTVDTPVREEKQTVINLSEPMLPSGRREEYSKTPALANGVENRLVVTPHVTSSFPVENVASPVEHAKAYMGSRPSKVSSSILGMQTPALRDDPTLVKSENIPLKSPVMSIVPRATRHAATHENGFVTQRSRGRSAIYNMARTPYARIYPTSTLKGDGLAVEGEPLSSSQSALHHDMLSGSKQGAVKRRSSVLDNDIGSVGPIRRIRQKSNLLYSKESSLPLSSSSLSIPRSRMGIETTQQPSSSMQKPIIPDDVKHSHMKYSEENVDDTIPSSNFSTLPSKSSEVASKILHQLDKLVSPKEKASKLRLPPNGSDNSPTKLSPSMLRGQALRSMEMVDSSKLLDNIQVSKLDGPFGNLSASAQNRKLNSQKDKVENSPLKLVAPCDGFIPVVGTTDASNPRNQVLSSAKSVDSFMIKSVSDPPQKKRVFHMSAHEDYVDLDDDAPPNGTASSFSPVEKETTNSIAVIEKTTSGTKAIAQENPSSLSVVKATQSAIDGQAHVGTTDLFRVGEKVDVSTSTASSLPDPTSKPVMASFTEASFGLDKRASSNGSIANPPLFNFGNKVVSPAELTAIGAPSKEITQSGPVFGLEKDVSSNKHIADAPFVNFGSNNNVDNVSPMPFTALSSVHGEFTFLKSSASSDSKLESSISSTIVAGATDSMPKVHQSDNGDIDTKINAGTSVRASELAVSSASPSSLLTSGNSLNQNCGLFSSSSHSSSPFLVSNDFTGQNIFSSSAATGSATADSTGTNRATIAPAIIGSSNSSSSTPVAVSSSSTTSFFEFGSSPVASTSLPLSSSGSAPVGTKSRQDAHVGSLSSTAFDNSSAGSVIFGLSSSAITTVNSQSQCSIIGASGGSVLGAQASFTSGFATSSQTQSVPFGSSDSSPSFGLTGNTAFSLGSSLFPSSSPAANTAFSSGSSLFPSSSSTTNVTNSSTIGFSTSASSSAANSVSSNSGTSSTLFGSSWQSSKSPFDSTFSSSSSSGFSLGTSTSSVASASSATMFSSTSSASNPQFSFTSAAASTTTQPPFGSPTPVFTFTSANANNDQMSMEDSMAEDTVQATPQVTSIFGQQPAPVQSNYIFGPSTPSGASPFQFGSQQNIAPQNPSPFQSSSSLEFNAGGSFSLGTGGGDKAGRRIVKVKHKQRKK